MILGVIFLEKYMVTITGYAAIRILILIACILIIIGRFGKKEVVIRLATKAILLELLFIWLYQ